MMHRSALGDFVGAKFAVPSLYMGGLGDFVPAHYSVPQNPIGLSGFTPGRFGMGEFVAALYTVPQNPIMDGTGLSGLGCGGGCDCKQRGMGDLSLGSFDVTTFWNGLSSTEQYAIYGVGALAAYMLFFQKHGGRRR